jgi:hypothetical protein
MTFEILSHVISGKENFTSNLHKKRNLQVTEECTVPICLGMSMLPNKDTNTDIPDLGPGTVLSHKI